MVWVFTWGHGHSHPDTGQNLNDHYVRISADSAIEARLKMIARYGRKWCGQYESLEDAGVFEFGLVELVEKDEAVK